MAERLEMQAAVARLLASGVFDAEWYEARYPDARRSMLSPAEHFLRIGQKLGRLPSGAPAGHMTTHVPLAPAGTQLPALHQQLDEGTRRSILASGLFDEAHYRDHNPAVVAEGGDALEHYCEREHDWHAPTPSALFSPTRYRAENPDIASMSPLAHAALHGLQEGRQVFDPDLVNGFLERNASVPCAHLTDVLDAARPAVIYCWDKGNFFFTEIAAYLEVLLVQLGFDARCANENEKPGAGGTAIIVAPHEFCIYGEGQFWSDDALSRAVYCNTEQWHTGWFTHTFRFLRKSGLGLDINPTSASGLNAMGYKVAFIPLVEIAGGPFTRERAPLTSDFAAARAIEPLTYPDSRAERAYDILFVGACNARRSELLARLAPVLANWTTFIHCPRFSGPVRDSDPDTMNTADAMQLAWNTRLLLNIHQGESQYFEWHRLYLLGIAKGCVVLSEPCLSTSWVQAGTHYIACEASDMGDKINWLLGTSEGAAECERIARNCVALVERLADIKAAMQ